MKSRGVLIGILILATSGVSLAFETLNSRWATAETTIWLDIPLFAGRSDWNQAFIEAAGIWAPEFQLNIQNSYADPCETGIERNGVDFRPDVCGMAFGSQTLAIAVTISSAGQTLESDIIFNSAEPWDIYNGPDQFESDFRRVAVHELGHLIGLGHEDTVAAIMVSLIGDLEAPTADDRAGVQFIYADPFIPATLAAAGPVDFIPIGPPGGPFAPIEQVYRVYNLGTQDMTFGVFWPEGEFLDVQDSVGAPFVSPQVLAGGASTTVKYILNASAVALTPTIFTLQTTIANLSNESGDFDVTAEIRVNIPPDFDLDGAPNESDICPFAVDTGLDTGGVGGTAPDGIGDACQCGDVSGDGIVDLVDAVLVTRDLAALLPGLAHPIKCSVDGVSGCAATDRDGVRTVLTGVGSLQQSCTAATGTL